MSVLKIKAAVRKRDGHRCADCGRQRAYAYAPRLDVHRISPGSEYTVEGCVTLCRRCHKRRHRELNRAYLLRLRVSPQLKAAIRTYIARSKPEVTIKAIVEAALADFFAQAGLWPPPPSQEKL